MEGTLLNETWSSGSQPSFQNVTSTIDDIFQSKHRKQASIDWVSEKRAVHIAMVVLHFTFLIIGLTGNALTIAVLVYKKWTNVASRHVLMALAVSDTIMIITHTFIQDFLRDLLNLHIRSLPEFSFNAIFLFYHTSKMTSSWFMVFLCFKRFIAVTLLLKVKQIITKHRIKIYIVFNYLTMAGFNIFRTYSSSGDNGNNKKAVSNDESSFRALALIEMLLYSIVPIILMCTFTPIIILKLYKHNQARKRISSNLREKQQLQDLIRTTAVLITIVIAFVICVAPISVFQLLKCWQHFNKKEMETVFPIFLYREVSQRFEKISYSINFFLYIITYSTFRTSFFDMLHVTRKTETSNIKDSKKTRQSKALSSPEGQKCSAEPTSKKTAIVQLESSYTEELPCTTGPEITTRTVPVTTDYHSWEEPTSTHVPSYTASADGHVIPNCNEDPTSTNAPSKTAPADGHMIPNCNEDQTSTNAPSKTAPADGHVIPNCNEETTSTNAPSKTATTDGHVMPNCNEDPTSTNAPSKTAPADGHMIPNCNEDPTSTNAPSKTAPADGHVIPNCNEEPTSTNVPSKTATTDGHVIPNCYEEPTSANVPSKTATTDGHVIPNCNEEPTSTNVPSKTATTDGHVIPNCNEEPTTRVIQ